MLGKGLVENDLALREQLGDATIVNVGWCEVYEPRMPMVAVVPREESRAELAPVLVADEAVWVVSPVLHGSDLGLGERIVVARSRTVESVTSRSRNNCSTAFSLGTALRSA